MWLNMRAINLEVMETQVGRRDKLIRAEVETVIPSETLPSTATTLCNRDQFCLWFPRKQYKEKPINTVLIGTTLYYSKFYSLLFQIL
jgi:hypothetical protein